MADDPAPSTPAPHFDVRSFGARGDGSTLDTAAVQAALDAAGAGGGGTVVVPAGDYPCFTLHLRSGVTLHLAAGAILRAASPSPERGGYDPPEPNPWGDELQYQDFGHSHWRNSLLVGEHVAHIAITGEGLIDGAGLQRHITYGTIAGDPGPNGTVASGAKVTVLPDHDARDAAVAGPGNKAIALRECCDVTLRGFRLHRGGHFAVLATGCQDLHITDLLIDTNRDGIDIDGCQRVTVRGCTVNSPMDDAIVLKSSYALGRLSPCEDVLIEHCTVSGYDVGSVLDGSYGTLTRQAPDQDGPTGRIKIGTETNGDFRRIRIRDCVFRRSRGLALETVDGGVITDVIAERLEMNDVTNAAIFLLLGHRARGPVGTPVGALQGVTIRDVRARGVDGRFPMILQGLPGHPLRDLTLQRIGVATGGGVTRADVARQAIPHVNPFFLRTDEPGITGPRSADLAGVPERPRAYPEPSMFGLLPTSGLFARHVAGLTLEDVTCTTTMSDERPRAGWLDVTGLSLTGGNLTR